MARYRKSVKPYYKSNKEHSAEERARYWKKKYYDCKKRYDDLLKDLSEIHR